MSTLENIVGGFETTANLSLVLATAWIVISEFAAHSRSPVLIAKYAEGLPSLVEFNRVVGALLRLTSKSVAIRFALESDVPSAGDGNAFKFEDFGEDLNDEEYFYRMLFKKDRGFWFIDSLKSFQRLEADLTNERWHYQRNGYFCIIYTGREKNRLETIELMFRRLFAIYVVNVNVLLVANEMVYVYTYYPYTETRCFNTQPMLANYYGPTTNYTFKKPVLFPKKLSNMWNCPLTVTTWTEAPFMIIQNDESTGEFIRLRGIEGMLVMLLSKVMNFNIKIKSPTSSGRGYVLPNGTSTGAMKMLIDRETNITILALMLDKERCDVAQPAYSYLSVPLKIGIPKGRMMSPFNRIINPFQYMVWLFLTSSLVLAIVIIFTFRIFFKSRIHTFIIGAGISTPFTNLWNVFYGGSLPHSFLPRRNFARYLLAVWMLYTLVLRTAYTGQLFIILQDSRARTTLSTVDEVVTQNFTFYTYPLLVPVMKNAAKAEIDVRLFDADEHSVPKLFDELAKNEDTNVAVALLGHFILAYNQQNKKYNYRINILRESLVTSPLTFYMPKHSYLTVEVNDLLLKIMSAGLISKYEEVYIARENQFKDTPKKHALLSLKLLSGLFSIYLGLLFLCTVVFLLELWAERSTMVKKLINFFNC